MNNLPEHITPDLIAAFLNGEAGDEQSRMLQEWIHASSDNQKYFEDLKKTWELTGSLEPAPVFADPDKAWAKVSSRIDALDAQKKPAAGRMRFISNTYLRIAAMLLPPILVVGFYLWQNTHAAVTIAATTSSVHDTLPDMSHIVLNKNTKLSHPKKFTGKTREVALQGEAFFEVTHDTAKPFIVHSGNASVRVLGTSFNVRAYDDSATVEVFVNTGRVMLYDNESGNSVILYAGSTGVYNKITRKALKLKEPKSDELFWMNKTLIFSKTDLRMVIDMLQRYYHITIVLKKDLLKCRLSATFRDQPIDTIIDIIAKSFDLKVTKNGSTYELEGNGCE